MDFTVAICTYNGAERLPEVLDQLLHQVGTEDIEWEVLVVDNNSNDDTAAVVARYATNWRQDSQLRYVFEAKQGATYARYRAVQEARSSDLIGFLDDDNLPADNWIAEAYRFGCDRPQVGAYGGIIHAKLDELPPPYFEQIKGYLTIYNRGATPFHYKRSDKPRRIPAAPGSVIRKQAWQDAVPPPEKLLIPGRDEKTMAAGEDAEIMFYIQNSKWEVWHNPKMEIWHHIPPYRLEQAYLLRLAHGYGLSNHLTRVTRFYRWQRPFLPFLIPFFTLRNSLKILIYYLKNKNSLPNNVVQACELQSQLGQLYSPFLGIYKKLPVKDFINVNANFEQSQ
ncbi:glycosyltransferase family 2 protein [Coleofasciculus sp. FACHB-64]|uniref:hormogonium polysaccharide biosynthesis glycosyltransferase HpsE n=1 Tax=Cyanophyceae TaxID=3028117 RepID=UPI00168536DF|nr:glycosyltransferase family 2 protein [Coleofasciculus sp. FACHB-501]MBD2048178.1 glycosyltransferase family 2 protein [Coleofasciculus sp. FACHB-64]